MNPKIEAAYACVGKGWHGLLDKYLPQILDIDPDCELIVKEKYGTLRIQPYKVSEGFSRNKINAIANRAEKESETICETCGAPGYLHLDGFWIVALCDECFMGGRGTPVEEFPEDGLHLETEKVITEYLEDKEFEYEK